MRNPSLPDGAFLVRDSESTPGDFSLSVKMNGGVDHYRVLRDQSEFKIFDRFFYFLLGCYYLWEVRFNSLNELVQYHMEHSISRTSNLLLRETQSNRPPPQNHAAQSRGGGPTFQARAAYTFNGEENNEISFDQGDTITVHVHLQNQFNLSEYRTSRSIYSGVHGFLPVKPEED